MKSANIINRVIVKSIIFVIGLTIGVFSANAFYKIIFSPFDQNEIRPLLENVKDFQIPDLTKSDANPLILIIESDADRNLFLNNGEIGTLDNLNILSNELEYIFKARKENGVFVEFSGRANKEVIILPKSTIKDADLYNLVKVLESSGANPIMIDWNTKVVKWKIFICPRMINAEKY